MNELFAIGITIFASFIAAFGSLYLKKGAVHFDRNILKQFTNKNLFLGFILFSISTVIYTLALKFGPLSVIYPITSLAYIWISLLSVRFLNEKMNNYKWIGVLLIILGVILITR